MFLTPAVAEHYKPQNTHRKKSEKISDPRPTPKLATSASAAAHNSPFCARCDLRPKAPKANKKKRTCTAGFEPVTANMRICYYPATGPLHVGSSWPEQEMGSFGSFLYIKEFSGDEIIFGCPPSVVFYCVAVCRWVRLYRRVLELQVGPRGFGASV